MGVERERETERHALWLLEKERKNKRVNEKKEDEGTGSA